MVYLVFSILLLIIYLFLPGYFLQAIFFPRKRDFSFFERIILSISFSIIFLPLLILVENLIFKIPINQLNVSLTVLFLILFSLFFYFLRIGFIPSRFFSKINSNELFKLIPKRD